MTETEEQSLERYLQRSGPLARAYLELGDERPSASLDQAVISQARSAIAERPHARRLQWRWTGMTALAATVLLSFALVMRIALEPQPTPAGATTDQQRFNSGRLTSSPDEARANLAAPASTDLSQPEALAPAPAAPAVLATAPADNATATAPMLEAKSAKKEDGIRARNEQDEGSTRAPRRQKAAGARHDLATAEKAVAEPSAAADAAHPSEAAASSAMSPMTAPRAYGTTGPEMSPSSAQALQKAGVKPPEEWLDEIARLRANGEEDAAEREYTEFRKVYPDYVPGGPTTPTR